MYQVYQVKERHGQTGKIPYLYVSSESIQIGLLHHIGEVEISMLELLHLTDYEEHILADKYPKFKGFIIPSKRALENIGKVTFTELEELTGNTIRGIQGTLQDELENAKGPSLFVFLGHAVQKTAKKSHVYTLERVVKGKTGFEISAAALHTKYPYTETLLAKDLNLVYVDFVNAYNHIAEIECIIKHINICHEFVTKLGIKIFNKWILGHVFIQKDRCPFYNSGTYVSLGMTTIMFIVTEWIFETFPKYQEGKMSELKRTVLDYKTLNILASGIGLKKYIFGDWYPNSLADCLKALVCAILIDSGLNAAGSFIMDFIVYKLNWGMESQCRHINCHTFDSAYEMPRARFNSLKVLEKTLRYEFRNLKLLHEALTHPQEGKFIDYQRLEFLGDAVLEFCVMFHLITKYPDKTLGEISNIKQNLVSNTGKIAKVEETLGLKSYIKQSRSEPYVRSTNTGDLIEALIGAVFYDTGLSFNGNYVDGAGIIEMIIDSTMEYIEVHPKQQLQQVYAKITKDVPKYETVSVEKLDDFSHKVTRKMSFRGKTICQLCGKNKDAADRECALFGLDFMKRFGESGLEFDEFVEKNCQK